MLKGGRFQWKEWTCTVLKDLKQKYWAINYDISSVKGSKGGGGTRDEGKGRGTWEDLTKSNMFNSVFDIIMIIKYVKLENPYSEGQN